MYKYEILKYTNLIDWINNVMYIIFSLENGQ